MPSSRSTRPMASGLRSSRPIPTTLPTSGRCGRTARGVTRSRTGTPPTCSLIGAPCPAERIRGTRRAACGLRRRALEDLKTRVPCKAAQFVRPRAGLAQLFVRGSEKRIGRQVEPARGRGAALCAEGGKSPSGSALPEIRFRVLFVGTGNEREAGIDGVCDANRGVRCAR